jgi:hypothetical protein
VSDYPILVERWGKKAPSDRVVCERCHAEFSHDPSEGDPYDLCLRHGNPTVGECGGQLVYKYAEADKCGGCGKLGFYDTKLSHCCSRKCMLQAEYAATLGSGAA